MLIKEIEVWVNNMFIKFTVNTKVGSVKKTSVETGYYNWLRGSKEVRGKK